MRSEMREFALSFLRSGTERVAPAAGTGMETGVGLCTLPQPPRAAAAQELPGVPAAGGTSALP